MSFQCHRRRYDAEELQRRRCKIPKEPGEPDFLYSQRIGDCPWNHITGFSSMFSQARKWWETGQLGVNYLQVPRWFNQALGVAAEAAAKARAYKRELDRAK